MSVKSILAIALIGSGGFISAQALNLVFYREVSLFLAIQIALGPCVVFAVYLSSFKEHWLRVLISIFAFSGLFGLANIASEYVRYAVFGEDLNYSTMRYAIHGLVSGTYLVIYLGWRLLSMNKDN